MIRLWQLLKDAVASYNCVTQNLCNSRSVSSLLLVISSLFRLFASWGIRLTRDTRCFLTKSPTILSNVGINDTLVPINSRFTRGRRRRTRGLTLSRDLPSLINATEFSGSTWKRKQCACKSLPRERNVGEGAISFSEVLVDIWNYPLNFVNLARNILSGRKYEWESWWIFHARKESVYFRICTIYEKTLMYNPHVSLSNVFDNFSQAFA